jgi:uncharacterized protein (TIGR03085 family)
MGLASAERTAICDEFDRVGPDRPTLCAGWTTADLLAHLLVRERQPWAAAGILIPALASITESAMRNYSTTPWADRVALLRTGPPAWSPTRLNAVDEAANGVELFVHHEDVRRGAPGWEPRDPDASRDAALWSALGRMGRLLYRRSPVGVVLRRPSGEQQVVKTGSGMVTVVGEPGELMLHAFGRDAARVELEGAEADVAALRGAARGV